MPKRLVSQLALSASLVLIYFAAGKLGLTLAFVNASATAVWPPTGIALAAFLLLGYGIWPAILLGAFLVNVSTSGVVVTSIAIAVGNTLEGIVGAYLVKRFAHGRQVFDRAGDVLKYVVLACLVGTTLSATGGVASLTLSGLADWASYGPIWLTWWLGDAVGALIVAPVLILWAMHPRVRWQRNRVLEAILLLLAAIGLDLAVFGGLSPIGTRHYPLGFIILPVIVWSAFRFGRRATATVALVLSGIALWGTLAGFGPFALGRPHEALLLLQAFMGLIATTGLSLAAMVTERNQAEAALREREDSFRLLFESNPLPMWVYNQETLRFVEVNEAAVAHYGYPRAAFLQMCITDIRPEEDVPRLLDHLADARPTLQRSGEWRHQLQDGRLIDVAIRSHTLTFAGRPAILVVAEDITERKQAETARRESEERYRSLIEASPSAIVLSGMDAHIFMTTPQAVRLFGYESADEMVGRAVFELIAPEDHEKARHKMEYALAHGSAANFEYTLLRKDGSRFLAELNAALITDPAGNPVAFTSVIRDITEQKRAEMALIASEERYRSLIEVSPDAIAQVDTSATIRVVSRQTVTMLGYSGADELVGRSAFDFVAPEDHEKARAGLEQVLAFGHVRNLQYTLIRKDGSHLAAELNARLVVDDTGTPQTIIAVVRDITERKQAEAALATERALLAQRVEERTAELRAANTELARAARLKDEFLASMSHELRTPLNAILGLSEALEEQVYGPLDARQIATVQQIAASGQHLLALINDILDLSKVEAGKVELELGDVAVAQLCQSSLQFIMAAATKKGLTVGEQIDPAVKTVRADERRLKQILVNLLSNAVKFTPAGGSIGLEIAGDGVQQAVHFTVWDTGIGIAEADVPRLFQPFVQLDSRLARAHAGTGLGLALVRRLTELHGGRVALASAAGVGSRFTISLPWHDDRQLEEQPAPPLTADQATIQSPSAPQVLLVEDNEVAIRTLSDYLRARGYQVVVARDGREAIVRAQELHPDMILMDIQLPEMDGLEAMRHIRSISELHTTPIIATTATAMPGDCERCLEAGATAYLPKPVRLQEMLATIEHLLDDH